MRGASLRAGALAAAGRGSPGALALVLGGSRARQTTGFVFVVDTAAAQLDSAGKLVLEIR